MNQAIKLVLSLSLSGSILAVIIFAAKPFMKHKLSKSLQYYLWIVVLLRLIIPFSFEGSIMNNVFYGNSSSIKINSQSDAGQGTGVSNSNVSSSILPSVQENVANGIYNADVDHSRYLKDLFNQYVLYLWLFGIIVTLAVNTVGYVRFLKYLNKTNKPAADEENEILADLLNGKYNVRLVRNSFVSTPMLIGIVEPCIVIPDISLDKEQLKNILLHEISHLRRFDIWVKWLTMIAAAIHWFNPIMYFIKKEISYACELACDEAVIKNLNAAEKQAYGDTLIFIAAEHKYPSGVLQATMCEEKKSLKERLIAIMQHHKKPKIIAAISIVLLAAVIAGAAVLGASVGAPRDNPPNIYISAEGVKTKEALLGGYSWNYRGKNVEADSSNPANFNYKSDNIVDAAANQQIIVSTQKIKLDRKYNFTIDQVSVYKDGKEVSLKSPEPSFMNGNLYLETPPDDGEYVYSLVLNFKDRGTVNYGFLVRVNMPSYDLVEISKYKTPYVGDASKVSGIVSRLPVPDDYFKQQYISMETSNKPYKLNVFYEPSGKASHSGAWPITDTNNVTYSNMQKNALVLFSMIDNVDNVTFAYRDSQSDGRLDEAKYNTTFTFSRADIEKEYGNLPSLGKNLDLLEQKLSTAY